MFRFLQKYLSVRKQNSDTGNEMDRKAVCPVCSYKYKEEEVVGNSGKCPQCGSLIESAIPTIFT